MAMNETNMQEGLVTDMPTVTTQGVRTEGPLPNPDPNPDPGTNGTSPTGKIYFFGVQKTYDEWKTHRLSKEQIDKIKAAMIGSGYFDANISSNVVQTAWTAFLDYAFQNGKKGDKKWDLRNYLGEASKWAAFDSNAYTLYGAALTTPKDKTGPAQNKQDYMVALRRFASDNGIYLSDDEISKKADLILNSTAAKPYTLEKVKQDYRVYRIAPKFKQYSDEIIAGNDVKELAGDYLQMMAQTLEIDPDTINLAREVNRSGSLLNKALIGTKTKDASGKTVITTADYTEFDRLLKEDYRWKYTKNANAKLSSFATELKNMFGF